MAERVSHYSPSPEGLAVIFKYNDEIAIVRHAENYQKGIRFGDKDLPRETRERINNHHEPLTQTLDRTLKEELGIEDWRQKGIRIISYNTMDCKRPDGSDIKAHIVEMESENPLVSISDTQNIDHTEIIGVEMISLDEILKDQNDGWRTGPDGRELIHAVFEPYRQYPIVTTHEEILLRASD